LLKLPGFGPYTARAVSSLAFEEPVGVLDGNVIRFLSRFYSLKIEHWKLKERAKLQKLSDAWVQNQKSSQINQALMELGALICASPKPLCLLCPVRASCKAFKKGAQEKLPLKKEKKATEFWHYQAERIKKHNKWAFVKNTTMPFLKGRMLFPGLSHKLNGKAQNYDFKHSIMNYQIFITIKTKLSQPRSVLNWYSPSEIKELNPSSLIKKILEFNQSELKKS
ncbi:MAG: A/G-specific adenine glycosylase, partial [Oligoflexia bacterium]|nr:A/G-specific adenine glycosylase [Oligoflexia bacterium]